MTFGAGAIIAELIGRWLAGFGGGQLALHYRRTGVCVKFGTTNEVLAGMGPGKVGGI